MSHQDSNETNTMKYTIIVHAQRQKKKLTMFRSSIVLADPPPLGVKVLFRCGESRPTHCRSMISGQ